VPVPRDTIIDSEGQLLAPPLYFGVFLDIPPIVVRNDRLRTELGIEPIPLEQGLREDVRVVPTAAAARRRTSPGKIACLPAVLKAAGLLGS
jgi:hypothetical protein